MRPIKSGILLASAVSLFAISACNPATDVKPAAQASSDAVVATVNGTPIGRATVDMIAKQRAGAGQPDTPEFRNAIIENLTLQLVIAQEAIKKGLDKSPEVAQQMEAIRQSVLANAYVQDFMKNNPVTDEMIKAEYERVTATLKGTEYKVRHILVEKESDAKDIIAKLKKDLGSFGKLAAEKTKDQSSKATGGDLGWVDLRRMVPEFSAAVSSLEKGKFTQDPVKTQFGYHVILLDDSRPIQPPPLEDVKPQLSQRLQQQNMKKHLDGLKTAAKIEVIGSAASAPSASASASAAAK